MQAFPHFFRIRQTFARPRVLDIAQAVQHALTAAGLPNKIRPGQSVAITAGIVVLRISPPSLAIALTSAKLSGNNLCRAGHG